MRKLEPNLPSSSLGCNEDPLNFGSHFPNNQLRRAMIPSSTIDFDVVKARQNGQSAVAGRVLFSFTNPAKLN
jgi:hypothetical protein